MTPHGYVEIEVRGRNAFIGSCQCGWTALESTPGRCWAEQDWERHHKEITGSKNQQVTINPLAQQVF